MRHLRSRPAHYQDMTVCSWCDDVISRSAAEAAGQVAPSVSHGICRSCLSDALIRLRPTVQPTPLFAQAPALR